MDLPPKLTLRDLRLFLSEKQIAELEAEIVKVPLKLGGEDLEIPVYARECVNAMLQRCSTDGP